MKMYWTYANVSVWLVPLVLVTGCAPTVPPPQHYRTSSQTVSTLTDSLDALAVLQQSVRDSSTPCAWGKSKTTFSISGTKIQFTCSDGSQQIVRYSEAPEAEVISDFKTCPVMACVKLHEKNGATLVNELYSGRVKSAKEFADAWYVLAQPRKLQDPATDSVFSDTVTRYRAEQQTYAETLRRVQVQVESALKEHRVLEAATLYRDALKSAAGWPEGHFNLALLYGELEFYTDATNEMRRYLFLVPTAPDARAAQDKIYEWELKAK